MKPRTAHYIAIAFALVLGGLIYALIRLILSLFTKSERK